MKFRLVIPDQDLEPLSGESPVDAIHRAVIGRAVQGVPVERTESREDGTSPELTPESARSR